MDTIPLADADRTVHVAIGHHPTYGICAATPHPVPAAAWILDRLGFRPVPDHPTLLALADQERDGPSRAARATALLRRAGFRVDADLPLDPPAGRRPAPIRRHAEPEVAFAEHPRLGIIASTADGSVLGAQLLEDHDWHHHDGLDIYALPATTEHSAALHHLARTTVALLRAGVLVAVEPRLAQTTAKRRIATTASRARTGQPPAPAPALRPAQARTR